MSNLPAIVTVPAGELVPVSSPGFGPDELAYAAKSRAANTVRGYKSDWAEWTAWCNAHNLTPLPADPAAIARHLTFLARCGAKVGTMSRRLSAIRFAHDTARFPSPLDDPDLTAVWEGIRRTHGAPPDQALPLMPPLLWNCLETTPTRNPDGTPNLAGLRDHVVLLVGFVGARRRSELVAIDVEHLEPHEHGLVLHIPRSKTNQTGINDELVVLPSSITPGRCPVAAIKHWQRAADITTGPLLRGLTKTGKPRSTRMNADTINEIVKAAVTRTGTDPAPYSAHSLRAGFVTYAHLMGQSDRAIAHQTKHASLASLGQYVRISDAWQDNAAVELRI